MAAIVAILEVFLPYTIDVSVLIEAHCMATVLSIPTGLSILTQNITVLKTQHILSTGLFAPLLYCLTTPGHHT
jgi:hypothetical protein